MLALLQDHVELLAVLGCVDAPCGCAEDRDAQLFDMRGQLDGGLPAELHDGTVRLLGRGHAGHVLGRERLEIQAVGRVEVGGHGLRVVVDDNGLTAELLAAPRPQCTEQ